MKLDQCLIVGLIAQKGSGWIFGGNRTNAANSGSRCSNWNNSAWNSNWNNCVRAACDDKLNKTANTKVLAVDQLWSAIHCLLRGIRYKVQRAMSSEISKVALTH